MTKIKSSTSNTDPFISMLQNAHGKIPYNMTNDYMFRAVLQSNNKVLRGLICSLLHLDGSEVRSVEVTNPIILGESMKDKEIRLDINVRLNNHSTINLEMQVSNQFNWTNRSLLYLCRSFDSLNRGDYYFDIQPAIHIGFLDYTLFPDHPEFYATYKLINMKNYHVYSDNFVLNVVDLSRIDLATDEDKKYHIDKWAALFKAATWEEVQEMAGQNAYLREASKSIFQFNSDEQIRKLCRDRIEYQQDIHNYQRFIAQQKQIILEKDNALFEKDNLITDLRAQLEKLTAENPKSRQ